MQIFHFKTQNKMIKKKNLSINFKAPSVQKRKKQKKMLK